MIVFAVKSDGLANSTFRDTIREKSHYTKSINMKFVIFTAFMAIYLGVDVHSAPIAYSFSNDKLTLNIPIEDVWEWFV